MKSKAYIGLVLAIIFGSFVLYAHSLGITGRTKKNGTGCTCHGVSPTPGVTVTITGPDQIAVNDSASYTVTITGGPLVRAGTDIAASDGALIPAPGSGLQLLNGELTHTLPKEPVNNAVTFDFIYKAPSTSGTQTIFANGNSVNFNGQNTGDQWNFADNKIINITDVTGVEDNSVVKEYKLDQNYPNPFNPSTQINFSVAQAGNVKLIVYDILGNEVQTLVNGFRSPGSYNVNFNSKGLSSGVYLYKLSTDNFVQTKKMIITK